ncbi:MAG: hypothetical protein ACK5RY_22305 [Dolichospermum sp.]|jgi:hypothetical protein|nr:hypothetical protein [Anabaena sp. 49628_E55]
MSYTLSTAPEHIIKNIETLKQIWKDSCEAIKNDLTGDYSRHLLLLLNDLHEEIDNNKEKFSNNSYGKKFFEIQIASYCSFKQNKKYDELDEIKKEWTKDINEELKFICEALSDNNVKFKFQLEDIPILIKRIEKKIISENSFALIIKKLYNNLLAENINYMQVKFLSETLILLFNNKGRVELYFMLEEQFEKFEYINTYPHNEYLYETLYDLQDTDDLCPKVWGSPLRNGQTIGEYIEEVSSYYKELSIQERLNFLINIYQQEPQIYKVIFNIINVNFSQPFKIGQQVQFYITPKDNQYDCQHIRYINETSTINKLYSDHFSALNDPTNFELRTKYCVAVDIQGVDNKFIAIKARQIAERTIAALSTRTRKIKEQPIKLSNDWVICNSQGDIEQYSNTRYYITKDISELAVTSQNNYREKLGRWISDENRCHPTVAKWLSSIDSYRQAIEAPESSQEILNSWFAVEKFSEDSKILSKQFLKIDQDVLKGITLNEMINLWLGGDEIKTVQLLLVLSELKFDLYSQVAQVRNSLNKTSTFYTLRVSESIQENLQDYLPINNELYKILYNKDDCQKYLARKIINLKDDVYNIYRIRNMLVHYGNTKSKLLDYYAKRCREYCHSLLYAIVYKIFQTSSDDEIMPLEFYFREMVIDANIALEAVKEDKMEKFRNWALS